MSHSGTDRQAALISYICYVFECVAWCVSLCVVVQLLYMCKDSLFKNSIVVGTLCASGDICRSPKSEREFLGSKFSLKN